MDSGLQRDVNQHSSTHAALRRIKRAVMVTDLEPLIARLWMRP